MKAIIWSAMLVMNVSAWAQAGAVMTNEKISDADLAEIRVITKDAGHPVFAPIQLQVLVLCKDNRTSKSKESPKWVYARRMAICAWGSQSYDSTNKNLKLEYSEATTEVGKDGCDGLAPESYDIKKLCAHWNR